MTHDADAKRTQKRKEFRSKKYEEETPVANVIRFNTPWVVS